MAKYYFSTTSGVPCVVTTSSFVWMYPKSCACMTVLLCARVTVSLRARVTVITYSCDYVVMHSCGCVMCSCNHCVLVWLCYHLFVDCVIVCSCDYVTAWCILFISGASIEISKLLVNSTIWRLGMKTRYNYFWNPLRRRTLLFQSRRPLRWWVVNTVYIRFEIWRCRVGIHKNYSDSGRIIPYINISITQKRNTRKMH